MPISPEIKNILFDLGGVILNLDTDLTYSQFAYLSHRPIDVLKREAASLPFFNEYERGEINDQDFREQLKRFLAISLPDIEIDFAWNAMLLDLPIQRIELLKSVGSKFRIFLLSNTNHIHLQCFNKIVSNSFPFPSLDHLFEKAYYSHLIKMRKPEIEIFEYVLCQNSLKADETLFLDDNLSNLQGAEKLGIKTYHVQHPDLIFTLFDEPKR